MDISSVLLVHFIFLGLFSGLPSSNPESMIVQSPEDNEQKVAEIRMEKSQLKISANLERPRQPVVRVMRPFVQGSRIIWREVGIESIDRIRDNNQFQDIWNNYRTYQPYPRRRVIFRRTTENGFNFRRASENGFNIRRTTENGFNFRRATESSINLRRPTGENIDSRKTNEESAMDGNSRSPLDGSRPQMPQNNVKGNDNNFHVSSMTTNLYPTTSENSEPSSGFNDYEDATKSTKRISPDSNFFAGIVNNFAFKLMEKMNLETNFVVSPLSIFIALSMCYLGSDGRTKAQIEEVLGMNENNVHEEHFHKGVQDLISLVVKGPSESNYELFAANGMFLGKKYTAEAKFEENLREYYRTELRHLDFENSQLALSTINEWVSENTRNMITNIINSPPHPLTPLLLLNAVFFKGTWKTQFPLNLTYNGKFHSLDGSDADVPLMTLIDETFPLFRSDEHRNTFIELPYKGDQISMIIALPYTKQEKPISTVRDQTLCYLRDAMVDTKLESVVIPKFRLEYSSELKRPLQELGITDVFNYTVNLSKLRKENDVYVSNIQQKSIVEVNEEGTMASAVTEVKFVPLTTRKKTNFVADHPFAFYIMHEPSGLVLFYGKVFGFDSKLNVANNRREDLRSRTRPNSDARG